MAQAQFNSLVLKDGDADGIFNIHNPSDLILDPATGFEVSRSQAKVLEPTLQDRYLLKDKSHNINKGVALGFMAGPWSPTTQAPATQPKTGFRLNIPIVTIVVGAAALITHKLLFDQPKTPEIDPDIELVPLEGNPNTSTFIIYAEAAETAEEVDDIPGKDDIPAANEEDPAEPIEPSRVETKIDTDTHEIAIIEHPQHGEARVVIAEKSTRKIFITKVPVGINFDTPKGPRYPNQETNGTIRIDGFRVVVEVDEDIVPYPIVTEESGQAAQY